MIDKPIQIVLKHFEAAEANLVKAESLLTSIEAAIPQGVVFGENPEYDDDCRSFEKLLLVLPKIDSWKPEVRFMELDEIAQCRLDAMEIDEISCIVSLEHEITKPSKLLSEYRRRFNQKRRELVRDELIKLIDRIDSNTKCLENELEQIDSDNERIFSDELEKLEQNVEEMTPLIGRFIERPSRWSHLERHIAFGTGEDLRDIVDYDWPTIRDELQNSMYNEKEPIPVEIDDIGDLVRANQNEPITTKLQWERLSDEEFERLIFTLISREKDYENPKWLTKTNAPDRGRDLSVDRVSRDSLSGTIRQRVIIQCKNWRTKSVSLPDIATLREQMKLWEPPRVDIHVIATSGRFTLDAIDFIERHNQSDSALRIEMWPESHLERLLANRPAIITEFGIR